MAGIWNPWTDQETGETIDTFAIVTTKANDKMEQVHNSKKRMPTILTDDLASKWLKSDPPDSEISKIASYRFQSDEMFAETNKRDFREAYAINKTDPITPEEYPELPGLI